MDASSDNETIQDATAAAEAAGLPREGLAGPEGLKGLAVFADEWPDAWKSYPPNRRMRVGGLLLFGAGLCLVLGVLSVFPVLLNVALVAVFGPLAVLFILCAVMLGGFAYLALTGDALMARRDSTDGERPPPEGRKTRTPQEA